MAGTLSNALRGAVAGFVATAPMTAVMLAIHRRLPIHQRYSTPPRQIAMEMAEVVGIKTELSEPQRQALTTASHFGYGSAMGAIYGAALSDSPGSPAAKGLAFGAGVWAASYLGWLPAADSRAAADRQGAHRNTMMIAAHVIWGIGLGLLVGRCHRQDRPRPRGPIGTQTRMPEGVHGE
jgi:hypothetical protein